MERINRTGIVRFFDASLHIVEEPEGPVKTEWERQFKVDVFFPMVDLLEKLSWTCVVPKDMIARHGERFASNYRFCQKGELKGEIEVTGRCIKIEMFQNVNAPDRSDHDGRYQSDKEAHMPYLMRLEMERTRRRLRDMLCTSFEGYEFSTEIRDGRGGKVGINHLTAHEYLAGCYETSCHFKGDLTNYKIEDYNNKSADGSIVKHGERVWFFDRKGRACTGIAYYDINNMSLVITGKYAITNLSSYELFTSAPENIRIKRNTKQRRLALEKIMSSAIKAMDFERAAVIRDILFPKNIDLFVVKSKRDNLYHRTGFLGYANNIVDAGKFTADEVKGLVSDRNEVIKIYGLS
ncbi:MAG: UvrB/UvrC motif-containing protein [Methylobacter sp.]